METKSEKLTPKLAFEIFEETFFEASDRDTEELLKIPIKDMTSIEVLDAMRLACNSHYELLEALKAIMELRSVNTLFSAALDYPHDKEDVADEIAAYIKYKAALSKAGAA